MQIMMIDSNDTKLRANNFKLSPITWSNFRATNHILQSHIKGEDRKNLFHEKKTFFNCILIELTRVEEICVLSTFQYLWCWKLLRFKNLPVELHGKGNYGLQFFALLINYKLLILGFFLFSFHLITNRSFWRSWCHSCWGRGRTNSWFGYYLWRIEIEGCWNFDESFR